MGDGWLKGPWFDDGEARVDEATESMWFAAMTASFTHVIALSLALKSADGFGLLAYMAWLPGLLIFAVGWTIAFSLGVVTGDLSWANSIVHVLRQPEFRLSLALLGITGFLLRQGLKSSRKLAASTQKTVTHVCIVLSLIGGIRILQLLRDFPGQCLFLYFLAFFLYVAIALPFEGGEFNQDGLNRWKGRKRF